MTTAVERKYAMTRMGKGVYLLPSNDKQTLWRISAYIEEGDASAGEKPIKGRYWSTAKRSMPTDLDLDLYETEWDFLWDSVEWLDWSYWHQTRSEAIAEALRT